MHLFTANIAYADGFTTFMTKVDNTIVNPLIEALFALAVVYFLWGVFDFLSNQDNEEKKSSGKQHMLWGIIGLTIMLGVWTILGFVLNTLQIPKSQVDLKNGTSAPVIQYK
jgi:Type IV secretion system pilin